MQQDGVIGKYAIGGAVGAIFYLETFYTADLDIFVTLPTAPGGALLSLSPIYEYLKEKGCREDGERIVIGDWPVQFLPPKNQLEEDALATAIPTDFDGVPTFVFSPEHLVAIALQTGRPKDYARLVMFLEQGAVNRAKLHALLLRHGLEEKWEKFKRRYLEE